MMRSRDAVVALLVLVAPGIASARADEHVHLTVILKNHRFIPAEIDVHAGDDVVLDIRNEDATAEQFDLRPLSYMEVVFGGGSGTVRLVDVQAGRYPFFGDYHSGTAHGVLVVEAPRVGP